jgi:hypothetical protein
LGTLDRGEQLRIEIGRLKAIQPDRVIARKERAVVGQQHQIAAPDHGVGRVDVDQVDLAGQQLPVSHVMVYTRHVALRQVVMTRERRPAVAAIEELVRERDPQLRQTRQIGNSRNAELSGPPAR